MMLSGFLIDRIFDNFADRSSFSTRLREQDPAGAGVHLHANDKYFAGPKSLLFHRNLATASLDLPLKFATRLVQNRIFVSRWYDFNNTVPK